MTRQKSREQIKVADIHISNPLMENLLVRSIPSPFSRNGQALAGAVFCSDSRWYRWASRNTTDEGTGTITGGSKQATILKFKADRLCISEKEPIPRSVRTILGGACREHKWCRKLRKSKSSFWSSRNDSWQPRRQRPSKIRRVNLLANGVKGVCLLLKESDSRCRGNWLYQFDNLDMWSMILVM